MNAATLARLFEVDHDVLKKTLDGLSHGDSLVQPQAAGNCLNWVLGHIVATRSQILTMLGEEPLWSKDQSAPYDRGSAPITDAVQARPLEELAAALDRSQERLRAGLARVSAETLASPAGDGTFGDTLAFFHFHEAYHAGQVALLRRMAGKDRAIP